MADEYTLGHVVRLIDALAGSTKAGFDRIESKVDVLEKRVDALTTEVRTGFDRLDAKFDRLETRVEALEVRP
jgi:outer membrane murein-binding lipoprotein Lpp